MAVLTKKENARLQGFIDHCREELHPIEVVAYRGLSKLKSLLGSAPMTHPLSKPFDPDLNVIPDDTSYSLGFLHEGEVIACVCGRAFDTPDFCGEYITSDKLFGNARASLESIDFEYVDAPPALCGTVVYQGGSYVHPDWRGNDLAAVTSRLGRVVALRTLGCDYHLGLVQAKRRQWALDVLGWPNSRVLTTGYHGGRDDFKSDIVIVWMDRNGIVDMCLDTTAIDEACQGLSIR